MDLRQKLSICCIAVLSVAVSFAMPEIPFDSAKALGRARGKKIDTGLVFVNGKYISAPYVVERWGTGIRINGIQVTGQIIDWVEFLKTQQGFKAVPAENPVKSESGSDSSSASLDDLFSDDDSSDAGESSLDDLFDDDPKPKKKKRQPLFGTASRPKPAASYTLSGDFTPNDASRALLKRINSVRTEIDRTLRSGGFICFGDSYLRVTGDAGTADKLLQRLPELLRDASGEDRFVSSIRAAGKASGGNLSRSPPEGIFSTEARRIQEELSPVLNSTASSPFKQFPVTLTAAVSHVLPVSSCR